MCSHSARDSPRYCFISTRETTLTWINLLSSNVCHSRQARTACAAMPGSTHELHAWDITGNPASPHCLDACSLAVVVESAHITIAYTIGQFVLSLRYPYCWPCLYCSTWSGQGVWLIPFLYALFTAGVYMVRHFLAGSSDQRQVGTLTGLLVRCLPLSCQIIAHP